MSLLSSLSRVPTFPKFYWKPRTHMQEYAAFGCKKAYFTLPDQLSSPLFGGVSFPASSWEGFPQTYFFEPEKIWEQEYRPPSPLKRSFSATKREDFPCYAKWKEAIEQCLRIPSLEKIVLARRSTFSLRSSVDPFLLLEALQSVEPQASYFAFQPHPRALFLGASPEMLYSRKGDRVTCDALAGTSLLQEILGEKEKREFSFVEDFIQETLSFLCQSFERGPQRFLCTSRLKHFYCSFEGTLKPGISDKQLIEKLHPTPALSGTPRHLALHLIPSLEPFKRGWYGGVLGMLSPECSELAVGIRSALLTQNDLHLFTGAGIVQGSNVQKEWNELEAKLGIWNTWITSAGQPVLSIS